MQITQLDEAVVVKELAKMYFYEDKPTGIPMTGDTDYRV